MNLGKLLNKWVILGVIWGLLSPVIFYLSMGFAWNALNAERGWGRENTLVWIIVCILMALSLPFLIAAWTCALFNIPEGVALWALVICLAIVTGGLLGWLASKLIKVVKRMKSKENKPK